MTVIARFDAALEEAAIGAEHAGPVPEVLSALPRKRALFSLDDYFRDGWDDLSAASPDPRALAARHASLLLGPGAVAGRRLEAALEWLLEHDAVVAAAEAVVLDRHGVRAMWCYGRERGPADPPMRAGENLLLVVRLPEAPGSEVPASVRLSDLAGPADPARREPWHLRHRLDEDAALDGRVDLVHTAEEPADLVREFGVLLDGPARRRVCADLAAEADRRAEAHALIEELYRRVPAHDLSRDLAEKRRGRGEPREPWDSALLAAPPPSGGTPLLSRVTPAQWEHTDRRTRPLRRDRALPGPLVHKEGLGEVFLTDHVEDGSGGVLLAGELPAAHRFYNDLPSPRLDLLPVLELCRQSGRVVAHAHHGVPLDARFRLHELGGGLTAGPETGHRREVRIEASVRKGADPSAPGLSLGFRITDPDGVELATARSAFSWSGEGEWRGLRAASRARHGLGEEVGAPDRTGLFPSARNVGRVHDGNVVLADLVWRRGETSARVAADPANPAMFEGGGVRPQDHVPETVLLEAARQAALWTISRHFGLPAGRLAVTRLDARFAAEAELDVRLSCTATVAADRGGKGAVAVRFVQDGVEPAEVMVEVVRA